MSLGIRTFYDLTAAVAITNNATLAAVGLSSPIAANERQWLKWNLPFSVGATGGIRFQVVVPAGGVAFELWGVIQNTVTPAVIPFEQNASAVINNALAVAGDHYLQVYAAIVNGATLGSVILQVAQDTVDPLTLTVKRGSCLEVIVQ